MKFQIETHGCKLNTADSQQLAREFAASGFAMARQGEGPGSAPDVYVLNSCTVTGAADRKARHAISAARRRFPGTLIVATGCYPERASSDLSALGSVDLVLTNRQKPEIVREVAERLGVAFTPCADGDAPALDTALLGRTRASVKIQEGCDQVCAYCIVPRVRGREKSVPPGDVVGRIRELASMGCSEVVLTGTQLGTYGFDIEGADLPGLLRLVISETGMARVRVSSLQPLEITDELLKAWQESDGRLCPHFHVPLQSGSDGILGRMRRRYTAAQFCDAVDRVRSAATGCSVTTDVICGFPGESDADHDSTVRLIEQVRFTDAHVFPYSERPGTSAVHYVDQIPIALRAERAAEIRALTQDHAQQFRRASVGQVRPALWEGVRGKSGLTDNYLRVRAGGSRSAVDRAGRPSASNGASPVDLTAALRGPDAGRDLIEDVRLTGVGADGVMVAEAAE